MKNTPKNTWNTRGAATRPSKSIERNSSIEQLFIFERESKLQRGSETYVEIQRNKPYEFNYRG